MKKFLLTTLSAIVLSAGAAQAQQTSNVDLSLLGGWSSHPGLFLGGVKTNVNDAYNVGARLGYEPGGMPLEGFSLDADYFYNRADYSGSPSTHLGSSSFMGDLIYHIPTNSPWGLYGGGGAGLVHDNLDGNLHGSSDVLGWQGLGGVDYAFTPSTSLFAEYRYQNAHNADIGTLKGIGNTSNNLSMGIKFNL